MTQWSVGWGVCGGCRAGVRRAAGGGGGGGEEEEGGCGGGGCGAGGRRACWGGRGSSGRGRRAAWAAHYSPSSWGEVRKTTGSWDSETKKKLLSGSVILLKNL